MNHQKNIASIAQDTASELTAWTDDMSVRLHLAEMSARDAWREIEPSLALAEGRLRTAIAALPNAKDIATTDVRHALTGVREVHVRGGDPMTIVPQVRDAAALVDPSLRLVNVRRANEVNGDFLWLIGLSQRITIVLSSVALVLSLAGIYAVLSFAVARRTRASSGMPVTEKSGSSGKSRTYARKDCSGLG